MNFQGINTSAPSNLVLSGVNGLLVTIRERTEETWDEVFDQIVLAGYELQNVSSPAHDPLSLPFDYSVFLGITDDTRDDWPMLVLLDDSSVLTVVQFDEYNTQLAVEFINSLAVASVVIGQLEPRHSPLGESEFATINVSYSLDDMHETDFFNVLHQATADFPDTRVNIVKEDNPKSPYMLLRFQGEGYGEALNAVTAAITSRFPAMSIENASVEELVALSTCLELNAKVLLDAEQHLDQEQEQAGVFDDASIFFGDRVVVNDGTAVNPRYLLGTVEHLPVVEGQQRVSVLLDNGIMLIERVDNGATGVVGYARSKRRKLDPIAPEHLHAYVDQNKWHSDSFRYLFETASVDDSPTLGTNLVRPDGYSIVPVLDKSLGLVANQPFDVGDEIVISTYVSLTREEVATLHSTELANYTWELSADSAMVLGDGNLLNHSEEANCDWSFDEPNRLHVVTANRKIEPGEELTLNYGWFNEQSEYASYFANQHRELASKGYHRPYLSKSPEGDPRHGNGGKRKRGVNATDKRQNPRSRSIEYYLDDWLQSFTLEIIDADLNGQLDAASFKKSVDALAQSLKGDATNLIDHVNDLAPHARDDDDDDDSPDSGTKRRSKNKSKKMPMRYLKSDGRTKN